EEIVDFTVDHESTRAADVLDVLDRQRLVREREIDVRLQLEVVRPVEQIGLADADLSLEARLVELQIVEDNRKVQFHPGLTTRKQNQLLVDQLVELGQAELGLQPPARDRLQEIRDGRARYLERDAFVGSREPGHNHHRIGIAVRLSLFGVVVVFPVERNVRNGATKTAKLVVLDVGVDHDRRVALVVEVAVDDASRAERIRKIEVIEDQLNVVGQQG